MGKRELSNKLKNFGKWIGENNFGRHSCGIWTNNCTSFGGFNDSQIVRMYINEPNKYQEFKKELHKKLYPEILK